MGLSANRRDSDRRFTRGLVDDGGWLVDKVRRFSKRFIYLVRHVALA